MIIQIDAGMEAMISLFEEGWAVGFTCKDANPPSYIDPSMHEFWYDGYAAGIEDRANAPSPSTSVH